MSTQTTYPRVYKGEYDYIVVISPWHVREMSENPNSPNGVNLFCGVEGRDEGLMGVPVPLIKVPHALLLEIVRFQAEDLATAHEEGFNA